MPAYAKPRSQRRIEHISCAVGAPCAAAAPPVRWGILGSGLICSDFVQALRTAEGCEVVAVGARSLGSAETFAAANDIPQAFGSYAELCECECDVVYLGTIHPTHKNLAIMAMRAGKNVLCEKPMTICKADTEELYAVAEECGVMLVEALWTRFFPTVIKARELIASGAIGDVLQFHGDFGFRFDGIEDDDTNRLTDPKQAGGASLDVGVYPISCMLLALGAQTPEKIVAAGTLTPSGVDKAVGVTVVTGGKLASITYTVEAQTPEEWRIIGSTGMIVFDGPAHAPLKLTVTTAGATRMDDPVTETITPDPPLLIPEANALNFPGSEGFLYQAQAVVSHPLLPPLPRCALRAAA